MEAAYSMFQRLFGESYMVKTLENIAKELASKVALYDI